MYKAPTCKIQSSLVDLTDKIWVRTMIPQENHAALRAGFAGYPANPRWNVNKYRAWKTGGEWRSALSKGTMIIYDSMLISATEIQTPSAKKSKIQSPSRSSPKLKLHLWSKQLLAT